MDNHPIPQDVTGFQFRLIGDMTIKQFAYLASGIVLAWISLSAPLFILLKLPLIFFFAGGGIMLAFVPIAGRPADTMIFYFFKAVFSPTQYSYKSSGQVQQTTAVGPSLSEEKKHKDEKEEKVKLETTVDKDAFNKLFGEKGEAENTAPAVMETSAPAQAQATQTQPAQNAIPQPAPANVAASESIELSQEATDVAKKLLEAQKEEGAAQDKEEAHQAHEKVSDLETQLQAIRAQKQDLEAKLLELQKQLAQKPQQVYAPSSVPEPKITENVRKVPANLSKSVGAPFVSDVPNLICGVVKDPRGNVLPNILIEVKDKDSNPVRAFKTNPLGQFASATPVINGTYTLTFEDPNSKQRFDAVELTANGTILQPIEVISIDAREDLRKELFG